MGGRGPVGRAARLGLVLTLLSLAAVPPAHADFEFLTEWGAPKPGELIQPFRVERDAAANTYVVDLGNPSVQEFDSSGNYVRSFGSYGVTAIPTAIAMDSTSANPDVYVAVFSGLDGSTAPNSQI